MIQPLRSTREVWDLDWFDVDVPVQFGDLFILPTCLYVVHRHSGNLLGHEFVRELDQRRAESLLARLIQEHGAPDELILPDLEEWDEVIWQNLSREYQCEVSLVESAKADEPSFEREEIEQKLASLLTANGDALLADLGPQALAQGLVRAVQHVRSLDKKRTLLQKALVYAPELPDSLLELGELDLQEGNLDSAGSFFLKVNAGLGDSPSPGPGSLRIRAQHGQLLVAWQKGELGEAIRIGEEMLRFAPTDYSGIRFLIPLLQLAADQTDAAKEYFAWYGTTYPNDLEDGGFLFAWGLSAFISDDEHLAQIKYRRGMIQNLYLAPLILDQPEPSPEIWQHNERGDLQYASDFTNWFSVLWERDAAAFRFLREIYEEAEPQLTELIQLRAEMAEFQDHRYEPKHRELWDQYLERERALVAAFNVDR